MLVIAPARYIDVVSIGGASWEGGLVIMLTDNMSADECSLGVLYEITTPLQHSVVARKGLMVYCELYIVSTPAPIVY